MVLRLASVPLVTAALLRAFAVLSLLAPCARAQDTVPDPGKLVPIDRVVATVNDTVILYSELYTLAIGEVNSEELKRGGPLPLPERQRIFNKFLQDLVNRAALAQAAKTIGVLPPDRVEELYASMLADDEKQQIRDFGSMQKFSQELARQNRTWESYEREQRISKLADLTQQMAVAGRLQNQRNLFITPRMMREYWRARQTALANPSARLEVVGFAGDGAEAAAAEAAAAWREQEITATELAKRFEAKGAIALSAVVIDGGDERSKQSRPPAMVEFALAGPAQAVHAPVATGSAWQVWKIVGWIGGKQQAFDDPETQVEIRRELERRVVQFLLNQTISRALERTAPWEPWREPPPNATSAPIPPAR